MGADYIPEDNILGRVNAKRTRKLLEQCREANFNSIRVWGGGYYPDDYFYDICDELGLVVWQDFMFACAVYDLNDEFDLNVRAELADNIKRIRHHACLGLWCGNNEMEWFVDQMRWVGNLKQKPITLKCTSIFSRRCLKNMIQMPSIGPRVLRPAAILTFRMIQTGGTFTIGRYGMATSLFPIIGIIFSVMCRNLVFSLFPP